MIRLLRTLSFGLVLIALAACGGGNENANPDAGPDANHVVDASDAATQDGDVGDAGDGGVSCVGPNGCWACEPTTTANSEQWKNRCTSADCSPFDNARLGGQTPP